jgi:hypothetical protein
VNEENTNQNDISGAEEAARLRKKMSLVQDSLHRRLPEKEVACFEERFLSQLQKSTENEMARFLSMCAGMCIGGFVVGVMPSDCYKDRVKIFNYFVKENILPDRPSSSDRPSSRPSLSGFNDSQNENNIVLFWENCFLFSLLLPNKLNMLANEALSDMGNGILDDLDKVLKDSAIDKKIRFAAFNLKANAAVFIGDYEETLETLETLQMELQLDASKSKVQYWIDFVSELRNQRIRSELAKPIYVEIPDEEFLDSPRLWRMSRDILSNNEMNPFLKETTNIKNQVEVVDSGNPKVVEPSWEMLNKLSTKVDILTNLVTNLRENIPLARPQIQNHLLSQYPWISGLSNPGELVTAEQILDSIKAGSCGAVVVGYCSTIEAEIRNKLIRSLQKFLINKSKESPKSSILILKSYPHPVLVKPEMKLYDIRRLFSEANSNLDMKSFVSTYSPESQMYLTTKLAWDIKSIEDFRNLTASAHGGIVPMETAQAVKDFVLGTPDKPGMLKRLHDIEGK